MRSQTPANSDGRRRRLSDAELTPEQRAAVEARRAERQTPSIRTNWPETSKPIDRNTRLSEVRN